MDIQQNKSIYHFALPDNPLTFEWLIEKYFQIEKTKSAVHFNKKDGISGNGWISKLSHLECYKLNERFLEGLNFNWMNDFFSATQNWRERMRWKIEWSFMEFFLNGVERMRLSIFQGNFIIFSLMSASLYNLIKWCFLKKSVRLIFQKKRINIFFSQCKDI